MAQPIKSSTMAHESRKSGVVHIGQVGESVFFVKVASRLPSGEGVDLIGGRNFCDIRTFQKELATIGTKNFANG